MEEGRCHNATDLGPCAILHCAECVVHSEKGNTAGSNAALNLNQRECLSCKHLPGSIEDPSIEKSCQQERRGISKCCQKQDQQTNKERELPWETFTNFAKC